MQTESEDLRNETAPTLLDVAKSSDKEQKKAKSSTSTLEDLIDRLEFNEVDEDEKGKCCWCLRHDVGCVLVKTAPDDLRPVRNQRIQEQEESSNNRNH
jgi:hypothetical protein